MSRNVFFVISLENRICVASFFSSFLQNGPCNEASLFASEWRCCHIYHDCFLC